jgi:hypothetical protein
MKIPANIHFDGTSISEQSLLYADLEYFANKTKLLRYRKTQYGPEEKKVLISSRAPLP